MWTGFWIASITGSSSMALYGVILKIPGGSNSDPSFDFVVGNVVNPNLGLLMMALLLDAPI
jgi:hypothetical protein